MWGWSACWGRRAEANLPTRSLESAGASGAALGCAETKAPWWASVYQPGQSPIHKAGSSLEHSGSSLGNTARRSAEKLCGCVTVTTSDVLSGGLSAVMQDTVLPLWLKVGEGLAVPTNYRKDEKGTLNSRGLSAFRALFLQWPYHVLARFCKTQRLRLMASENRIAQCSLCFKATPPTHVCFILDYETKA